MPYLFRGRPPFLLYLFCSSEFDKVYHNNILHIWFFLLLLLLLLLLRNTPHMVVFTCDDSKALEPFYLGTSQWMASYLQTPTKRTGDGNSPVVIMLTLSKIYAIAF
jgi:hypothetical protein